MKAYLPLFVVAAVCASPLGCGGTVGGNSGDSGTHDSGKGDAGSPPDHASPQEAAVEAGSDAPTVDHGHPSTTYPAFPPSMAQLAFHGGHVMKDPIIVAITWDADGSQATFDAFADGIGGTAYWKAMTHEYGVGAASSGDTNHVHMSTTAPTSMQDSDLQDLVTMNAGITTGWPAPTEDTIYAFFLPPGTSLKIAGFGGGGPQDACSQGILGYHQAVVAGGGPTSYAVVPSCKIPFSTSSAEQQSTMSMSHEISEAVTDPQPASGYTGFDTDHFAFTYSQLFQVENGDACEFFKQSFFEDMESSPTPFDFWVQRTWSNASGSAGHDPCVPPPAGKAYFNVTPLSLEKVDVTVPGLIDALTGQSWKNPTPTLGYHVPASKTVKFQVGFYSDGPTGGPWTISVAPSSPLLMGTAGETIYDTYNPSSLTATVDKTSGENGEKAYVTVTVKSQGTLFDGEIVTVTSTLGGVSHYMPIWIGK